MQPYVDAINEVATRIELHDIDGSGKFSPVPRAIYTDGRPRYKLTLGEKGIARRASATAPGIVSRSELRALSRTSAVDMLLGSR